MIKSSAKVFSIMFVSVTALLIVFLFCLLLLTKQGFEAIHHSLALLAAVVVSCSVLYIVILVLSLFMRAAGLPVFNSLFRQAWLMNSLLFPLIIKFGRTFGYSRDEIMLSFVETANRLSSFGRTPISPENILLLLPHCIQLADCKVRINNDPKSCLRCGKCKINELLALTERYGIKMIVVTGGTLARKKIKDIRPQAVLAVACERDLTSGLQDIFPLPAIGILNKRPYGPCFNTDVDVLEIEERLVELIGGAPQGGKINGRT